MNKNLRLVSAIVRGAWMMDTRTAEGYLPLVTRLLAGEPVAFFDDDEDQKPAAYAVGMGGGKRKRYSSFDEAEPGSVAVIPVQGPIMKDDGWCGTAGTQTMRAWAVEADQHPNISAVLLHMDTGGGSVDGTFEFAEALSGLQKPVVTWVDGLAASAGYALAVRSKHIMMSHATAELGSIGTMVRFRDWSKAYDKMGVTDHVIRATDSHQKNEDYLQATQGNYKPMVENILDPTNDIFVNSVRQFRAGKLKEGKPVKGASAGEPLNGQMYLAEKAIDLGLADSIGTFDDAVDMAVSLAAASKPAVYDTEGISQASPTPPTNMYKLKSAWTALVAFMGLSAAAGAEHVEAAITDQDLERLNGELSRLQTESQGLTASVATLKTQLEQAQAEAADWKHKAEAYGSQPGTTATNPVKTGGDEIASQNEQQRIIDELPHNRALDNNPLFAGRSEK